MVVNKHYRCIKCNTLIIVTAIKKFQTCKCGELIVDGNSTILRIFGNKTLRVEETPLESKTVYRIRHNKTGLYYKPRSYKSKTNWSTNGKIYSKTPSLLWVLGNTSDVTIEKYRLELG